MFSFLVMYLQNILTLDQEAEHHHEHRVSPVPGDFWQIPPSKKHISNLYTDKYCVFHDQVSCSRSS